MKKLFMLSAIIASFSLLNASNKEERLILRHQESMQSARATLEEMQREYPNLSPKLYLRSRLHGTVNLARIFETKSEEGRPQILVGYGNGISDIYFLIINPITNEIVSRDYYLKDAR